MKRDPALFREILLFIEEHYPENRLSCPGISILTEKGFDAAAIHHHLVLLEESGYILGFPSRVPDPATGEGAINSVEVMRLTGVGYDFLDSVRSDSIWLKTQEKIKKTVGSAPLEVFKAVAAEFVKTALFPPGGS